MNYMATAKKAVKKVATEVKKVATKVEKAIEPVLKGSPEWLALKAEARKRLDNQ